MSSRVRELLEEYTSKIEAEIKMELMSAITGVSFSNGASRPSRGRPAASTAAAPSARRSTAKGEKRPAAELEALQTKFLNFVAKNPGLRVEQINKELGTRTKDLALPIRKLLADKKIKSTGQKRSTTYAVRK